MRHASQCRWADFAPQVPHSYPTLWGKCERVRPFFVRHCDERRNCKEPTSQGDSAPNLGSESISPCASWRRRFSLICNTREMNPKLARSRFLDAFAYCGPHYEQAQRTRTSPTRSRFRGVLPSGGEAALAEAAPVPTASISTASLGPDKASSAFAAGGGQGGCCGRTGQTT